MFRGKILPGHFNGMAGQKKKKIAGAHPQILDWGVPLTGVRASGCFHCMYYPATFLL